jgi:hypothetical protein
MENENDSSDDNGKNDNNSREDTGRSQPDGEHNGASGADTSRGNQEDRPLGGDFRLGDHELGVGNPRIEDRDIDPLGTREASTSLWKLRDDQEDSARNPPWHLLDPQSRSASERELRETAEMLEYVKMPYEVTHKILERMAEVPWWDKADVTLAEEGAGLFGKVVLIVEALKVGTEFLHHYRDAQTNMPDANIGKRAVDSAIKTIYDELDIKDLH